MTITVEILSGKKQCDYTIDFPVVPRVREVIWIKDNRIKELFGTSAFVVTGVYYHFVNKGEGVFIEAEPYKP